MANPVQSKVYAAIEKARANAEAKEQTSSPSSRVAVRTINQPRIPVGSPTLASTNVQNSQTEASSPPSRVVVRAINQPRMPVGSPTSTSTNLEQRIRAGEKK